MINCDEYTLFAALLQWFKARRQWDSESNLKSLVENLKNCIRWTTLSLDEFNHINTLEVDFLTQAERHEIADIIRGGCSVLAKRRLWFWKRKLNTIVFFVFKLIIFYVHRRSLGSY